MSESAKVLLIVHMADVLYHVTPVHRLHMRNYAVRIKPIAQQANITLFTS